MITTLGLDLDGVLANTPKAIVDIASQYGVEIDVHHLIAHDVATLPAVSHLPWNMIFQDPEMYRYIEPMDAAYDFIDIISGWSHIYNPFILTSRPISTHEITYAWIREHLPVPLPVVFTEDKAWSLNRKNVKVFIEDHYETANKIAGVCNKVYLIDWPYNRDKLPKNVIRSNGLEEVLYHLDKDLTNKMRARGWIS